MIAWPENGRRNNCEQVATLVDFDKLCSLLGGDLKHAPHRQQSNLLNIRRSKGLPIGRKSLLNTQSFQENSA